MQVPLTGILEPEAAPGAVQRVGNGGKSARSKGGGDQKRGVAAHVAAAESRGLRGDFPPLESSPEEGIPESFRLSCQVSFLQHRLNFLPPACGW